MIYRIAICEDSAVDAALIEKLLSRWANQHQEVIQVEVFPSAESFLFQYAEDTAYDILLLDIELGAMDGVTMAKQIRRDNEAVQIIFVTGFPDYIAEGYEVAALHYLMKPINPEKLFSVLDRAIQRIQKAERMVLLPVNSGILRFPIEQIQYVEAFSHSVVVTTEKTDLKVKLSLSEIERRLGDGFIHCHRSYLVNIKYIARLNKNEVILDSGKSLPLSRKAAPLVHRAFISYYTEEQHETF